ncbi:hypothetical protein [Synechococcus sp. CS-197]|uniref:hypothetical protein n=1 Tax=Synechococcus sp. CS-197 TaxID=2847985 RepID=UPI000152501A|nr:hypothetical protein [Synechococcus sp. CS-197]MCT0250665.1 hypothetical protein [Synechococcus sp. CS-197]CAK23941.1 Conserved hypothetical protein [Synechococcus sp. WH 7803]
MARSRETTRFNRYLAKKHRQVLRGQIRSQRDNDAAHTVPVIDHSDRLMDRAISRDQSLDLLLEEEPAR